MSAVLPIKFYTPSTGWQAAAKTKVSIVGQVRALTPGGLLLVLSMTLLCLAAGPPQHWVQLHLSTGRCPHWFNVLVCGDPPILGCSLCGLQILEQEDRAGAAEWAKRTTELRRLVAGVPANAEDE